jgi:hypothetical protein
LSAATIAAVALWAVTAFIAEVAGKSTAGAGITSSTWTPTTSVTAAIFGSRHLHGSFDAGAIVLGLSAILLASILAAIPCIGLMAYALGWEPDREAALIFGVAIGIGVEIVVFNLLLNWLQASDGVYRSLPSWGWWVGMAAWGATLGASMARRGARRATEPAPRPASA